MKSEKTLQQRCLKLLNTWEGSGKAVIGVRTNAGKVKNTAGRWIELCPKGWPDITACIDGRFTGFELKTGKGRQSQDQKRMAVRITLAHGDYVVIRDEKELNRYLRERLGEI
jgi:hypothetical protein